MKPQLSDEQRRALDTHPDGIEVEDQQTHKVYILTDIDIHQRAMKALREQEDHAAIQSGIDDMEAGRVVPFEEVSQRIRRHLQDKYGLPLSEAEISGCHFKSSQR